MLCCRPQNPLQIIFKKGLLQEVTELIKSVEDLKTQALKGTFKEWLPEQFQRRGMLQDLVTGWASVEIQKHRPKQGSVFTATCPGTTLLCPTWLDPHARSPHFPLFLLPTLTSVFTSQMEDRGMPHRKGMWRLSFPAFQGNMSGEDMLGVGLK